MSSFPQTFLLGAIVQCEVWWSDPCDLIRVIYSRNIRLCKTDATEFAKRRAYQLGPYSVLRPVSPENAWDHELRTRGWSTATLPTLWWWMYRQPNFQITVSCKETSGFILYKFLNITYVTGTIDYEDDSNLTNTTEKRRKFCLRIKRSIYNVIFEMLCISCDTFELKF